MSVTQVTLKLATSMDGRIALANRESQWITTSESRARVHMLRAAHDAIMVGVGTLLSDDPLLTARTVPLPQSQPLRIVVDSQLRTPAHSRLVQSAPLGRVALATVSGASPASENLTAAGAEIWQVPADSNGRVSPTDLLARCAVEGVERLFLEGGSVLAASFIRAGLVDTLHWFRAPILLGGDGIAAIGALGLDTLATAPRWRTAATERIGDDVLETYVKI